MSVNINKEKNAIFQTTLLLIITIGFLLLMQFSNFTFEIFGIQTKKINLFSDITKSPKKEIIEDEVDEDLDKDINDNKVVKKDDSVLISKNENKNENNNNSTVVQTKKSSAENETKKNEIITTGFNPLHNETKEESPSSIIEYGESENSGIKTFIKSLSKIKSEKGKIRIAYFGDSAIEGDILIQDFRDLLQKEYNGRNVGFMPITSVVATFRQTILHTFSEDWTTYSLMKGTKVHKLGISGYVFSPKKTEADLTKFDVEKDVDNFGDSSWVQYKASEHYKTLEYFNSVSVYYSKVKSRSFVRFTIDGKEKIVKELEFGDDVKEIKITPKETFKKVKINFLTNDEISVYGANFDDSTGIYVDNFSFRGISGNNLTKIKEEILKDFNKYLNYDLVILQYGLNISDKNTKSYAWYKDDMVKIINYLKNAFTNANFLVVSVYDMSIKSDEGELITNPAIPKLVKAQLKIAKETETAFFNLYEAMGGEGSMKKFVKNKWANYDYTHLNSLGGKKVAELIFHAIVEKLTKN